MADQAGKLGRRIRELRRARGLTQAALAERLDISENYLGSLERGDRSPSLQLVETIADAFGVPVLELFRFPEGIFQPPSEKRRPRKYQEVMYKLEEIVRDRSAEEVELIVDLANRIFQTKGWRQWGGRTSIPFVRGRGKIQGATIPVAALPHYA